MKQTSFLQTVQNNTALNPLPEDFLRLLRCALISALQDSALLTADQTQQVCKMLRNEGETP